MSGWSARQQAWLLSLGSLGLSVLGVAIADETAGLPEVIVTASKDTLTNEPTDRMRALLELPATFGDPLQAIYALPGIVQTSEGWPMPAVRGSGPQDNRYFVDGLPAGALFHAVMGNSIFAEDVLHDFGLHAAGYGAQFGGATGAVFDISLRAPRRQTVRTTLESSVIRAGVLTEGALSDRSGFYFSYRESLVHLILPTMTDKHNEEDDLEVTGWPRSRDLLAKYVYDVSGTQQLSVLALGSQDSVGAKFGAQSDSGLIDPGSVGESKLRTQFVSTGLRWDYDGSGDFAHASPVAHDSPRAYIALAHLDTRWLQRRGNGTEHAEVGAADWTLSGQWAQPLGANHVVKLGIEQQRRTLSYDVNVRYRSCSVFAPDCATDPGVMTTEDIEQRVDNASGYLTDEWQLLGDVTLTSGLRTTRDDYLAETQTEPRVGLQWRLPLRVVLRADWGRYHQSPEPIQMLPPFGNPALSAPQATHYVIGARQTLRDWSWSIDAYYKSLRKIVAHVDDERRFLNSATGESSGAELLISKERGNKHSNELSDRWSGWLSVAYARTQRELDGASARFNYDTPWVINLVTNYRIGSRLESGLRWTYRSGFPYTPIVSNKENPNFPGYFVPVYGALNSSRASPFHRLDLHFGGPLAISNRVTGSWYIDIVNLYNRDNGGSVVYKPVPGSSEYTLENEESIPLVPSVGIKLVF